MYAQDALNMFRKRDIAETAHLALLAVIGVLTIMLITLGAVVLRQKRKIISARPVSVDTERAVPLDRNPSNNKKNNMSSSTLEVDNTTWIPPQHALTERSITSFQSPGQWLNPIAAVPPVYHSSVDHDDSDVLERRVGLVRTSLLRNPKSARTLAAMQSSHPALATAQRPRKSSKSDTERPPYRSRKSSLNSGEYRQIRPDLDKFRLEQDMFRSDMDKFRPEPDKLRTEQNKPRPDQNKMRPDLDKFRPDQDKYRRKDRRDTVSTVREEIDMYSRIPPLDPRTGENRHGLGIQPQNFI